MLNRHTDTPFLGSQALAEEEITRGRLHGPDFVALHRDVFVGAAVQITARVRVLAVSLRAGPGAVVAGPLAALAWGAECPWNDAEAITVTDRRLARDRIRLRVDQLAPEDVAQRFGVAITSPTRTAFDLARRDDPLPEVVAAADALGHACDVGPSLLRERAEHHPGARGLVRLRRVAELMDPRACSLMETRSRLVFVLRNLPAPVPQYRVVLPNGRVAYLDLAWPEAMVGVEYDGDDHREPRRHADDLDRQAGLDDLGWDVGHVTGRQVYRSPDALAARVARKLGVA